MTHHHLKRAVEKYSGLGQFYVKHWHRFNKTGNFRQKYFLLLRAEKYIKSQKVFLEGSNLNNFWAKKTCFEHKNIFWPKKSFSAKKNFDPKNHFLAEKIIFEKKIFFGQQNHFCPKKYFLAKKIFPKKGQFWIDRCFISL